MALYNLGLRSQLRKLAPLQLKQTIMGFDDNSILVDWVNRGEAAHNWGDRIAPLLIENISGRKVVPYRDVVNLRNKPVYTTIGSMLGTINARSVIVWGTGFIDSNSSVQTRALSVSAVRGPLSREKLLGLGIACPDIYGDPALLFPKYYKSPVRPIYDLGIIPHFKEKEHHIVKSLAANPGLKIIDIESGPTELVDQIHECRSIASSSLHGLVAADAYGIPANWIKFSERPAGDGFKFRDYLASTNTGRGEPLVVDKSVTMEHIRDHIGSPCLDLDLERFMDSAPFV